MRLRSHTVVLDSHPEFAGRRHDPSGVILRILHIWLADPLTEGPVIRAYVGSVRFCKGWYSRRELLRLFRRAAASARSLKTSRTELRTSLSRFLREYFRL